MIERVMCPPGDRHHTTNQELIALRRLADAGVSRAASAKRVGMSSQLVSYWNEKAKLGLVATGRWPAPAPPHPRELWEW